MTNVSSSIKSLSLSLVFFSFLFFFEWLYLAATTQLTDEWPYFEGLWGAAPLLVTGIVGLTTACGDTPCKRILLLVTSTLTLPLLCGLLYPISALFIDAMDGSYFYYYSNCRATGYL